MSLEMRLRRVNERLMLVLLQILGQSSIKYMEIMIKRLLGIFNLKLIRLEVNYKEKLKIRYSRVSLNNLI